MPCTLINSLGIELTWSMKSPLAPLFPPGQRPLWDGVQRGVIPPFAKEPVLSLSKERSGGIYGKCPDNCETIIDSK